MIYAFFDKINSIMNWNICEFDAKRSATATPRQSGSSSWADQVMEAGVKLRAPQQIISPTRTLSMVSASMLAQRLTTQARLMHMAMSGASSMEHLPHALNLSGQQFRVPPPAINPPTSQQVPPATWPTISTPELSNSLSRIESRLGNHLVKSFFDNLKMAALQEEQDTEANRAMLNWVVVNGIRIPNISRMTENEKVPLMKTKVKELAVELTSGTEGEGQEWEVVFVRDLNKQRRGLDSTIIESKFASEKQALEFRKNYTEKKSSKQYEGLIVTPSVRLATRVRVEIMFAICNLLTQHDKTILRTTCVQYVPRPMIKISRKIGEQESVKMMSFVEAVSWVKESEPEKVIHLGKAHD
jgi:hypothetical protein